MKPEFRNIIKRNIYPVPTNAGIPVGIHFTPTVRGQTIIGPGACMAFHREGYKFKDFNFKDVLDSLTNPNLWKLILNNFQMSMNEVYKDVSQAAFINDAKKMVPSLRMEQTVASFSGVMAQIITESGRNASDFIFEAGLLNGTTLHVRNAPSPACTSSFQLAIEITNKAAQEFRWSK
uniref:FAD dependent oxidoreductase domain-containing protein n=1 Tax=Arcella intermedia TaxID=1963864 RepID=A0A6B2LEG6_9EUKA